MSHQALNIRLLETSIDQSIDQSTNESIDQPIDQPVHASIDRSTDQAINHGLKSHRSIAFKIFIAIALILIGIMVYINQSTIESTNPSTEESGNQLNNQPINQSMDVPPYYKSFISNTSPRTDINGDIMDVHDGDILYHRGIYYYYGTMYGDCVEINSTSGCDGRVFGESCGWRYNHNVSLYTSSDLATWKPAPEPPFQMQRDFPVPNTVLFCSKVIWNSITHQFVMWLNWNTASMGYIAIASSETPYGPFKVVVQQLDTLERAWPSDFGLFQDDATGIGYVIYSAQNVVNIETLTVDFHGTLGSKNSSALIGPKFVEAPALFKRNGTYYASTGSECCYCAEGSPAVLYAAPHPLGPYVNVTTLSTVTSSQQTDITRFFDEKGQPQFMYRGDLWQHAPDHIKGHDPSYFGVIQWIDNVPQPLKYQANFTILVGSANYTS